MIWKMYVFLLKWQFRKSLVYNFISCGNDITTPRSQIALQKMADAQVDEKAIINRGMPHI